MHITKLKHFSSVCCLVCCLFCFIPLDSNIIFYCLPGGAKFFPGPARRKRGGKEEAGGGHSQSYTIGGGSDWSNPEGPTKGN